MGCSVSSPSRLVEQVMMKGSAKPDKSTDTFKSTICDENISIKNKEDTADFTPPQSPKKCHEDEIELIFKSKRANVYTAGVTLDNRINYKPKNNSKTYAENVLIRKFRTHHLLLCHFSRLM
jgi:hypothetical protein